MGPGLRRKRKKKCLIDVGSKMLEGAVGEIVVIEKLAAF